MAREISDGIHWIMELGPDRRKMLDENADQLDWYDPSEQYHIPQCAYLLVGSDRTLLFDTLSPASTETILNEVNEVLDGRQLDFLAISHPDVPHAGNTMAILEEHTNAELVAPGYGDDHELYRLDEATKVMEGDTIDLGNLEVEFHEATQLDAPVSMWMSERTTNTLFPVDWLGFPHAESEAYKFVAETAAGLTESRLLQFHGRVLFWYQYVDVAKLQTEFDAIADKFDPDVIAPAHGLVIRDRPKHAIEMMDEVVAQINDDGRIGSLG